MFGKQLSAGRLHHTIRLRTTRWNYMLCGEYSVCEAWVGGLMDDWAKKSVQGSLESPVTVERLKLSGVCESNFHSLSPHAFPVSRDHVECFSTCRFAGSGGFLFDEGYATNRGRMTASMWRHKVPSWLAQAPLAPARAKSGVESRGDRHDQRACPASGQATQPRCFYWALCSTGARPRRLSCQRGTRSSRGMHSLAVIGLRFGIWAGGSHGCACT